MATNHTVTEALDEHGNPILAEAARRDSNGVSFADGYAKLAAAQTFTGNNIFSGTISCSNSVYVSTLRGYGNTWGINYGTLPLYPGSHYSASHFASGVGLSQGGNEQSGIWVDGDGITMWSPCDRDSVTYYDTDTSNIVFRITNTGILYNSSGNFAIYNSSIKSGNYTLSSSSYGIEGTLNVYFPSAFISIPHVVVAPYNSSSKWMEAILITNVTTSYFTFYWRGNSSGDYPTNILWIATTV